jgi:hypothetical protein
MIAEIDQRGIAGEYGASSTGSLVQELLLVSPFEASARVRAARDFCPKVALTGEILPPTFPHVAAALGSGEIAVGKAAVIAKLRSKLPAEVDLEHGDAAEFFLVEQAKLLAPKQLNDVASRLYDTLNPDGSLDEDADRERRRGFTLVDLPNGGSKPLGEFTPELTMLIRPVLDALSAPESAGEDLPDTRTAMQRQHDALLELSHLALRSGTLPDQGGCPVTVMITTTAEDMAKAAAGERVIVADSYGNRIPLGTVLDLGAEIQFGSVTLSMTGGILNYGKTRRLASCEQRRALGVRDKGCAFPGCRRHASWTEVHHILEWLRDNGETNLINLVLLCRYHHRHFEKAGWIIKMADTGVPVFYPPKWIDPEQRPRRNTVHDLPKLPDFERERTLV